MKALSKISGACVLAASLLAATPGLAASNWDNQTWDQYRRMMAEQDSQTGGIYGASAQQGKTEMRSEKGDVTVVKSSAAQPKPMVTNASAGTAKPMPGVQQASMTTSKPAPKPMPTSTMSSAAAEDNTGEQVAMGAAGLASLIITIIGIAALF